MIVTLCTLTLESIEKRAFLLETFRSLDPESSTSFLNRCVFWWLNSLIWLGRTKPLQQQDLYTLNAEINSGRLHSTFKNQLLARVLKKHRLIRALLSTLKWQFALAILPRLLLIALKFSQPFLLDRLLTLLDSGKSATSSRQAWGIILAFALVYLGIAVVKGRYWHRTFTSITIIRGLLIGVICEKSLQLPNDEASKQSAITLISADTERINLGLRNMHEVWANVIELAVAIYLLQREVGAVAVVPLFIAAACAAGSFLLSRHVVHGQKTWMHDLQKRLNVTTSVFGRLESIKMLGILTWAGDTLSTLRNQEVDSSLIFRTLLLWSVVISEITSMLGPAAMFVAFSLVAFARNDAAVLANTAFASLAILSLIGPPLATLIQTIPNLLSALACLGRIQDLLEAPSSSRNNLENSIDSLSSQQNDQGIRRSTSVHGHETFDLEMRNISSTAMHASAVVEVCAAGISWAQRSEPVLRNVSFQLLPSQLLVVSGPVGCGKSTLLRAIIGEAHIVKGNLTAQSDSVAFCDQSAWLREGSMKGNIVNDSEYNHAWYESVIDACKLSVDIASFTEGENFAVSSQGQALSGGQKHRIALARALYSRRRLMIFDDVFSALDKRTAKNVFRKVFGPNGLLRRLGSTAVLVTQSSQHALFSDAVLMLSGDGLVEHCENPVGSGDDLPKDVPDELQESASTLSKGNIKSAKAPLLAYHIETLSGLPTIRAFGFEQEAMKCTIGLLEASQQPFYLLLCVQRWLGFVLDSIIACLVILIVVFALKVGSSASAGLTGAALVTVIACNQTLANLVESWTMMETCLGAVQRIKDFSEQKSSQRESNVLDMPFEGWPGLGRVEFNNYSGSYGSTSPPVLKNVSFTIRPGQKVAICGRTGSGKSSLALSLFKLLHTRAGSLTIDGLDIASLDDNAVRSLIASVPQEPLLFKDLTVRQNLRLDGATSDGDAKVALEMVGLWEKAIQQRHLDEPMSGLGLSEGQSQLFCIARALLRQSKLIVFDEATSSLDAESNQQFQLLLKNGLHDRTVVAIEHNPRNVLDYDKVVVLHEGQIIETGSPQELAKVDSAFRRLLQLS
ncbi:multidrug resistance-like protein [Hortaea werneckii]|nr:multidrug resistance-like protein [Hortaea werneckii]